MIILYNILFLFVFILGSPFFIYKLISSDKWREGLLMRLGFYDFTVARQLKKEKTIWFHAASVGEVKAVEPLLKKVQENLPQFKMVVTTVTRTGNKIARATFGPKVCVLYFPLDFCFSVFRAIQVIHPSLVILVESELWANFLFQIHRKRIPVVLINVRMSMRSFRRYRMMAFFVKRFVQSLDLITTPTTREAAKMVLLGASSKKIHIVGNLKFEKDQFIVPTLKEKEDLKKLLGFPQDALILLCGSTHPGEEEILISIYQDLLKEFPKLYLILAPRHPERATQIKEVVIKNGLNCQLKTELKREQSHHVLILNTIGELEKFYTLGDVIFIGKSLTRKGGQNFLEPARCGKPIIFGPHMENFEDMANTFVEEGGAIQVKDAHALERTLRRLLLFQDERTRLGNRAKEILTLNQGALKENLSLLIELLKQ